MIYILETMMINNNKSEFLHKLFPETKEKYPLIKMREEMLIPK